MNNETKPSLSQDGIGSDAETLFVGANPSKEFERNMEGVRGIIKGLSEVLKDGPAEGIDNTPWMDYEDAGKEAYAEERVIVFRAKPTGQKFAAHPEGHYIALTRPVEPAAPVVQPMTMFPPLGDRSLHFEDAEVLTNVKDSEYAKSNIQHHLMHMTCNEKWSLYRAIVEMSEASQPTPVVVPDDAEDLYFFEAGPDGAHSEVLPESKLKQAVHDSMCMCGLDWQYCGSDGVTNTCELLNDDSEWNSASDIKRWSWGQDFEDGYIRIIRLPTAQPSPVVVRPEETESKRIWVASYTASKNAGVLSRGLFFRSIHDSKEDAVRMDRGVESLDFVVAEYVSAQPAPLPSDQKGTKQIRKVIAYLFKSAIQYANEESGLNKEYTSIAYAAYCVALDHVLLAHGLKPLDNEASVAEKRISTHFGPAALPVGQKETK